MIAHARTYAAERGVSNIHFEVANIYKLPFPDNSFDAVFAHTVLQHLQEPVKALDEIRRVLKSKGVIGVREEDHGSRILAPTNPTIEEAYALYLRVW